MDRLFSFQGQDFSYSDQGSGAPVLLLHGLTESRQIWSDFAAGFSEFFRVICLDLPGHGRSPMTAETPTMEHTAQIVRATLAHLDLPQCALVGHSLGGYVSLAFAALYPEMLKGLVLFHSRADADDERARAARAGALAAIRQDAGAFIDKFLPDLFAPPNRTRLAAEIAALVAAARRMPPAALAAALEGIMARPDQRGLLAKLPVPVLYIAGQADPRVPVAVVLEQIALPPQAELLLLDGVGHMGFLEAPTVTYRVLKDFLARVWQID